MLSGKEVGRTTDHILERKGFLGDKKGAFLIFERTWSVLRSSESSPGNCVAASTRRARLIITFVRMVMFEGRLCQKLADFLDLLSFSVLLINLEASAQPVSGAWPSTLLFPPGVFWAEASVRGGKLASRLLLWTTCCRVFPRWSIKLCSCCPLGRELTRMHLNVCVTYRFSMLGLRMEICRADYMCRVSLAGLTWMYVG